MGICPECGGTMVLQEATAGFHFAHTYAPTVVTVPMCDSCSYFDTNSTEFREALHQAELRFEKKHPGLIKKMRDKDKRDDEIEEILHRAAEEADKEDLVVDPKDARVCRRCGTAARRKRARFCFECGNPLSPDASDPAIINPMLAAINRPAMALNPLQFLNGASVGDSMPPLAVELLENVVRAVQQVYGKRATLLDVHRFLTDQDFRDTTIGKLDRLEGSLRQRYLRDAFDPHPGEAEPNA